MQPKGNEITTIYLLQRSHHAETKAKYQPLLQSELHVMQGRNE